MSNKRTVPGTEAGTAAPPTPDAATNEAPAPAEASKPHSLITPPRERDELTGKGGTYMRDPATGKRTLVPPEPAAATATDEQPGDQS